VSRRLEPVQAGWLARRRWSLQELPCCSGRAFGVEQHLGLGSTRRGKPQLTTQCRIAVRQELAPPSRDDDGGMDAATQDTWQAVGRSREADVAAGGGKQTHARRQPRRRSSRSLHGQQKGKRRDGDGQEVEDPMQQVARDVAKVPADDLDAIHRVLDGMVRWF
jgi:hypothetical protein